jgi:hypothetical protein
MIKEDQLNRHKLNQINFKEKRNEIKISNLLNSSDRVGYLQENNVNVYYREEPIQKPKEFDYEDKYKLN